MEFNNESLNDTVHLWLKDSVEAERLYGHISGWDVTNVQDMSSMFYNAQAFNQDIGRWDEVVTIDRHMEALKYQLLEIDSRWTIDKLEDISYMELYIMVNE